MCDYLCGCVYRVIHTQLYQDKETESLSESKAAINMPEAGKCWQENIAVYSATVQKCKMITHYTVQSYSNPSIFVVWTQPGTGCGTEQGKGLDRWKWMMDTAKRSTPPPVLMKICQDPITILSTAYNVWMTIQNKDDNNAPQFYSNVKVNVRAV